MTARRDNCLIHIPARTAEPIDAVDQHDGIIDDDSRQAHQSDEAHDREIISSHQQAHHRAQDREGEGKDDGERLKERVELSDEKRQNQDERYKIGKFQAAERFFGFLDIAGKGN